MVSAAAIAAASSGVSLPCSSMLFSDRGAPILELAQVGQPLFERAQLRVVEAAGGFLAIAGDEGDGGLVVEQGDRRVHLGHTNVQFVSDALGDGGHDVRRGAPWLEDVSGPLMSAHQPMSA